MGNASDSTSNTNQNTTSTANSLTNFLSQMAQQYASQTAQNTQSVQTYSPSDIAKAMLAKATQPISSQDLAQYQSPYQKQVIDATMDQLNAQYGQQQNALTGNAISQNALGGDRAKVAQAALMGEQGRNTSSTLANLNQQGYNTSLSAAQADRAAQLQAAGLSGGTTIGGSQMSGNTTGASTSQTTGNSASAQTGTSHTVGTSTSSANSNPTIFGAPLNFFADGGGIIKRSEGGGVPEWARPPIMQVAQPMPMIQAKTSDKNMSLSDMQKLGSAARKELDSAFNSKDQSIPTSGGGQGGGGGGGGGGLSSLMGGQGGGAGGTTSVLVDTPVTEGASGMGSMGGDAAIGNIADSAAATEAGGAAADLAGAGAAADTAGAALGADAAASAAGAEAAGGGMEAVAALAALLANGGEVKSYGGGGYVKPQMGSLQWGQDRAQGMMNSQLGKGSEGECNGGGVQHRDTGGVVAAPQGSAGQQQSAFGFPSNQSSAVNGQGQAPRQAAMPSMPQQNNQSSGGKGQGQATQQAQIPQQNTGDAQSSGGKGQGQAFDSSAWGSGKGSSPAQGSSSTPQTTTPQAQMPAYPARAKGGLVKRRDDGGGIDFDPEFMDTGDIGAGGAGGLSALSNLTAEEDKKKERDANEWMKPKQAPLGAHTPETEAAANLPAFQEGIMPSATAKDPNLFERAFLGAKEPTPVERQQQTVKPFATEMEGPAIQMKTGVQIDPMTGKDIATKPQSLAGLAEPGADQIAPEPVAMPNTTANMGLESGTSDREESLKNYSKDTSDSRSFGAYGLNTLKGNSAWQFRDEYGKSLGITADPDTKAFKVQWDKAAINDPKALIAAEDAWHAEHVAKPTVAGLEKTGVPGDMAKDPAVQAYFADRAVQYGPDLAFGDKHSERIKNAVAASKGDTGAFLNKLGEYDKYNLHHDFKTYLGEHPQDIKGLENRIDRRLAGSMVAGSEGGDNVVGGRYADRNAKRVAPEQAAAPEAAAPGATAPGATAPGVAGQQEGNLLTRIMGAGLNPLKMSDRDLGFIAQTALGGLGGINKAVDSAQAGRGQDIQAQQHAVQMAMEAQKLQQGFAHPTVMGTGYDPTTGMPTHDYGSYNPQTRKYEPFAPTASNQGVGTSAIPLNLKGEDYRKALETQAPVLHDRALNILAGNEPMPKPSRGDTQAMAVNTAVRKIDPTFDTTRNDYLKKFNDPDKGSAVRLKAADTWYGHGDELSELAKGLPNMPLNVLNKGANWFKAQTNDANLNQYKSVASQIVDEKIKIITGSKPTLTAHDEEMKRYDPSLGEDTINKTLAEDMKIIQSRTKSMETDYKKKMGPYSKPLTDLISPEHQDAYERMQQRYGRGAAAPTAGAAPSVAAAGARPAGKSDIQLRREAQDMIAKGGSQAGILKQLADWGVR